MLFILSSVLLSFTAAAQLTVTSGRTAAVLAAKLAGPGITISSPVLTCPAVANGTFTSVTTPIVIDSGVLLTTGRATAAAGLESFLASTNNGVAGDPALTTLALTPTVRDACILEFDFIPNGDTVKFNYQFGSEEYINSTCGPYNDAFAFFISGPGITGTQNMALVPGTTIPVTVNSINSGIPGTGYTLSNCTIMGPGSPFTTYYVDNTGGTRVTYKGYTTKLTAVHSVIPCNTYHLKMSISDAGNALYDSGVFIEAGSLSTNAYWISLLDSIGITLGGVPHTIVKGCASATLKIKSANTMGIPKTVRFTYGGTGVRGVDFSGPDSAIIAAGADSVLVSLAGLPTITTGTKTVRMYLLSPSSCGITDSVDLTILDAPTAIINTPDTTICSGASFQIRATASPFQSFSWSPATGLSSAFVLQPIATPPVSISYSLTATLPGAGCPAIVRVINVAVINTSISMITRDTSICKGQWDALLVSGSTALDYVWTPATGLSNSTIQNPVAMPTVTTTYTVTATGPGGVCPSSASIKITVSEINTALLARDTTICLGASVVLRATSNTGPTFSWSPAIGLSSSTALQPVATPLTTTDYILTASWPGSGCPSYTAHVFITVVDATVTVTSPDTLICIGASAPLRATGAPLIGYQWSPAATLDNSAIPNPVATPDTTIVYRVTGTSPDGLCTTTDSVTITVANPKARIVTNDTTLCKGGSFQIQVAGDPTLQYNWTPATGLSSTDVMEPFATTPNRISYFMTATTQGTPCFVTDSVTFNIIATQLHNVTARQTIALGASVQLNADSATYYWWSPDDGSLNNPNINNPIATPRIPTTYIVEGLDKFGCRTTDSVHIDLYYEDMFIPGAFTPNNDGVNDVFRITNLGLNKMLEMSVYNRWGNKVYHAGGNDNRGWDGTYGGELQDLGVYNYLIIMTKPNGTHQTYKGEVTLLR